MKTHTYLTPPASTHSVDSFTIQRLQDVTDLAQVLTHLAWLQAQQADHGFFCTLDDVGQCRYTSGHASQDERIHLPANDGDFADTAAEADYATRCLHHVAAQLHDPAHAVDWAQVVGTLTLAPEEVEALIAMNRQPWRVLDDDVYVQRVPLAQNDLLIAALPNGYFQSDWDVFQNHAVIRRMAQHGYRLFGIGAATLGFVRDAQTLSAGVPVQALVDDIGTLYGFDDPQARAALQAHITAETWLLLGYTESFSETALREDRP